MATTGGTHVPNDGSDDPTYPLKLEDWEFKGRLQCLIFVLGVGLLALILSSLLHLVISIVLPKEWHAYVNFWLTLPALGFGLWFFGISWALTKWDLWLVVKENHAHIVINLFGGEKIKLKTDFYFTPPWWLAKPENLVNCEKLTVPLPQELYPAKDGRGGANVNGSFTYYVLFNEAEDYIGLDPSVVKTRIIDAVRSRIGPEIRKYEAKELAGDTTTVTNNITTTFDGAGRDQVERECHIDILSVTISSISPDAETMKTLRTTFEAELAKAAAPDLIAPLKDPLTGKFYPEDVRFDIAVARGIDPKREKKELKIGGDRNIVKAADGLGKGIIAAAVIIGEGKKLLGKDKDKEPK